MLRMFEPSFKLVMVLECAELGFWWLAVALCLFISSTGSFAHRPFAHNWMDGGWLEFLVELRHQDRHINAARGSPKHMSGRNEHKIREQQGKLTSQPEITNILNLEARNKAEQLLKHENVTGK
ncbi:hypothetical protein B0H13DRAFT_1878635 [Mycena leptocephala]|nr:hypothetical protein B0H13DRAFT_1902654 [Mycena leptocephala]KAJ7885231.1 hypothetical protein B0H13DRAFT_1889651 [Mycena leptocephala]KAJ7908504.1 hypothetical protein B0H13DRAFT_1878635 [Mycena leptocephala]